MHLLKTFRFAAAGIAIAMCLACPGVPPAHDGGAGGGGGADIDAGEEDGAPSRQLVMFRTSSQALAG
jgi:hypothetical protein